MAEQDVAGALSDGLANAWNSHDMDAFGRLFWDDAAFVNVVGTHMRGRESIQHHHSVGHAGPFKASTLSLTVEESRHIAPGVIVAHVRGGLDGDLRAPGETRFTLMTLVIEQRATDWKIVAAHNTNAVSPST